jgi:Protein of unknown function (DUF3040)
MLSDHERKALREIQRQLATDDPEFERSFHAAATAPPPDYRRLAYTIVIVLAALLATIMALAGSPGGTLAFAAIAGMVWYARHRRAGTTQQHQR